MEDLQETEFSFTLNKIFNGKIDEIMDNGKPLLSNVRDITGSVIYIIFIF